MSGQIFWQPSKGSPEYSSLPSPRMTSAGPSSRIHSGAVTPTHPRSACTATESHTGWHDDGKQQSHRLPLPPVTTTISSPFSISNSAARSPSVPRSPGGAENLVNPGSRGSGEMCAMKEVTLFSDDAKSKESTKQSMQEYGQLGELVIRSYTQQILSGLSYLHSKSTVHRSKHIVDPNGHVKLADFGMAKHIAGRSCPFSFKGSPYWLAPEIIRNPSGCNLAVDIWSLGCTVLEMATTKPPWSQYEGSVAAMLKIGNSKELSPIPDYLSDEGKDFVRQCLQLNLQNYPTAVQLLGHPFIKYVATLEMPVPDAEPSDPALGIGQARNFSSLESEQLSVHSSRISKLHASDINIPRNASCPVPPIGSPLLHSRSPQHLNGRMSPSPISSPRTTSGSSTPLTGGIGAIPFGHLKQSAYLQEGFVSMPKPSNETDSGTERLVHGESYDGQSVLADRVSRQLLKDHAAMSPSLDLSPSSPLPSWSVII
ncbi:hypothetical protein F3Y22_tig00111254pilonHSYRG00025 [Hibiscus syriacus]|uniref:Protein kinase domain-containing protein n=1 Tax=Hibiscus syriacus TaxID=106335 RepID=A0A6A2YSP4_HIBSY|nr:hypothetical protein F3Y22_tig00111254pilonHSYRG00025 [Hibiscus syriacus]